MTNKKKTRRDLMSLFKKLVDHDPQDANVLPQHISEIEYSKSNLANKDINPEGRLSLANMSEDLLSTQDLNEQERISTLAGTELKR